MPFTVFHRIEIFFPLREFSKDWNKWTSESAMSGNYGGWIRTSQPSCNSLWLVIRKHAVLYYSCGRLSIFCWLIPEAFHWVLLSVGLIGSSTCWNQSFGFPEEAHNRGLSSNPTINTTSPSLVEDQTLVWMLVVHFACSTISFAPRYCKVSTFHHLSQFVFKLERFCFK